MSTSWIVGITFLIFVVATIGYYVTLSKVDKQATPAQKDAVDKWKLACILPGAVIAFCFGLVVLSTMGTPGFSGWYVLGLFMGIILILHPFVGPILLKKQV